jgi:hypothetical protein
MANKLFIFSMERFSGPFKNLFLLFLRRGMRDEERRVRVTAGMVGEGPTVTGSQA